MRGAKSSRKYGRSVVHCFQPRILSLVDFICNMRFENTEMKLPKSKCRVWMLRMTCLHFLLLKVFGCASFLINAMKLPNANECTRTYLVSYTGACVAPDIWYPLLEIVKKSAKYLACRHRVCTMFSQCIRSKQALIRKRSKQAPQLEKKRHIICE
jgi:hypothetical protein